MSKYKPNALDVAEATLGEDKKVKKPVAKFFMHIMELWFGMHCRYTFSNMARWRTMSEKSYRNGFSRLFDWFGFNFQLMGQNCGKEILAVFDPSYIKKSGKKTYGLGKFWSGTRQKALKGLEIGCLAFVDVAARTALHGVAEQTPSTESLKAKGKTQVTHYLGIIISHMKDIKSVTRYLAADGYFMKQEFINPLVKAGLHVITKARSDANLKYLYQGVPGKGKGRHKQYDGKVKISAVDKRRIRCCYRDKKMEICAGIVYSVVLKQSIMAAFVYYNGKRQPEIIVCTDIEIDAKKMCQYYGLRFQIEFLIRDAKQYTGLEDCQARSQKKLHNHFNIAMTAVSIAKATYYLSQPASGRGSFSMADIKMMHMNFLITNRIFSNLGLDLSCRKIRRVYNKSLNFGRIYPLRA
jgi:hypothetical protein